MAPEQQPEAPEQWREHAHALRGLARRQARTILAKGADVNDKQRALLQRCDDINAMGDDEVESLLPQARKECIATAARVDRAITKDVQNWIEKD